MGKRCHLQLKDNFFIYYKTFFSFWLNEQMQEYLIVELLFPTVTLGLMITLDGSNLP